MDRPLVTVFVPCYNAGRFISETIDSVLTQTYRNFELLIIDDGSADNSREIIEAYAARDERIHIYYNECNRGVAYTRNRGIEEAQGKYLAVMDADDIATPDRLEKEVRYLEAHPSVGAVSGCLYKIDECGRRTGKSGRTAYGAQDVKAHMFFENVMIHSASMYRLDIVRKYKVRYPDDYHGIEDYMFWCRLLDYTDVVVLGEYFVSYRIVNTGLSVTNRRRCNAERIRCKDEVHRYVLESNGFWFPDPLLRRCLSRYSDMLPQGGVGNLMLMSVYFGCMLWQARRMAKPYYAELKVYLGNNVKRMLRETI